MSKTDTAKCFGIEHEVSPEEFNQMRTISEVAHRQLGLKIVEWMNEIQYKEFTGWYLSSDGWICHNKLPNFTKTLNYHCAKCGLLKHCCECNPISDYP